MTRSTPTSPPPGQYLTMRLKAEAQASTDAPLKITGVANDASVTDSFGTRIKLSQRALDGFMANPVMLLNHDVHNPIGKFTSIEYRGNKLVVEGEIDPGARTNTGASVADLAQKGILKAFSVRFDEASETRTKDYTQLDADVLDEISVVTLPSNRASLFGLRSKGVIMHGAPELLDREEHARAVDARSDTTRAAGPLALDTLMSRLYRAIQKMSRDADWDTYYSLLSVFDDYCVYVEYGEGRYYRQSYSVDAAGNVTLGGDEVEVLPTWVVVGSADEGLRAAPAISEADMGAVVSEVLLRVRTQLGLDVSGEPVLHAGAIRSALERAAPPQAAVRADVQATPPAEDPPADAPEADIPLDEGIAQLRSMIQATPPAAPEPPVTSIADVRAAIREAVTS